MPRNSHTTDKKAALARAETVLNVYPLSDCAVVEALADLERWADENDLDWPCILAAAEGQFSAH